MTFLVRVTLENHEYYLDKILEIENLSFSTPWSLKGFLQELENPVAQLWALMSDGILRGYFCSWMIREEMQLLDLAVHPKHRRQGYGSLLLTRMIDLAFAREVSRIWLEVRLSGSSARALYENFGFVESGLRKNYYTDPPEDALIMSLELDRVARENLTTAKTVGDRA
jgi:ribosomal-protein-alanine N-acetyltransferase